MASSPCTDRHDDVEDKLHQEHALKCKQNFIIQSICNSAHSHRLQLLASNGLDCTQYRSFQFRVGGAWRYNIILYIASPGGRHDLAVLALASEFHKADPTLLLQNRLPFLRCRWSSREQCPLKDLDEQELQSLKRNHLLLCDFVQAKALGCPRSDNDLENTDQRILPPTQRAVTMLFWPAAVEDEKSLGHAAIVRTGDDSLMCSGPISLESIREHEIQGFLSNDDIVHLPLEKATRFLAELDHRETAANAFLRDRSNRSAEIVKRRLEEEVRERISFARQGLDIVAVEGLSMQRENADWQFTECKRLGFSDLHAKIASRVAIHQLGAEEEEAVL